ncbi:hypothetical protein [Rhizobium sp. RU20A]|uniref:hypothetical protein n=1 Tax=Rhizobium sp. RU20A TaxID=1907412 RepID=UPI00122CCE8C|nr:hypothetical protein [Rhizobium sp. RU20A]
MRVIALILMMISSLGLAGTPAHAGAMALAGCGMAMATPRAHGPVPNHASHHSADAGDVHAGAMHHGDRATDIRSPGRGDADQSQRPSHDASFPCGACLGLAARSTVLRQATENAESLSPLIVSRLSGQLPAVPLQPPRRRA